MRSTDLHPEAQLALAKDIEHWPLDRLIPFARNARTHSDAQIAQIAASIREFGFTNPILVDSKDGIIAGHGRLLAARAAMPRTSSLLIRPTTSIISDTPKSD
jgi:ParB-like chromosome segregation protein Spo0J